MSAPLLSIVIPTRDRPHLLPRAVQSALDQTMEDLEAIVVDDASAEFVNLPAHPRLRVIRLSQSRGGAGARNAGTEAARGRYIAYLDDDDRLLPNMAAISLEALSKTNLPAPVGVISGIELVNPQGETIGKRLPPPVRSRGSHFSLEDLETGYSYNTKQTLVVEREIINKIGGWDETFRSRVHSDLFLRLNPVCSILGVPIVTYQLLKHPGARVSSDPILREESFKRLLEKHRAAFNAHPKMFANFVYEHACKLYKLGQIGAAFSSLCWALQLDPQYTLSRLLRA
ncbi:MAG TPA: glycosyl transferase family 2 [Cyanobacteria bacterium UBA11369]|nr:glycosyl transferase family 2 [Cyanobacteria bacterium UBA11371]HBE31195.1 glycosyl transferase family 2 [Cyanobacteria bacterium UBA11368]HBE52892.1 glycosyl transferase family 2 [Cyanobacteria bacterium UBA11369]